VLVDCEVYWTCERCSYDNNVYDVNANKGSVLMICNKCGSELKNKRSAYCSCCYDGEVIYDEATETFFCDSCHITINIWRKKQ
jgi:hypothetical protein